MENIGAVLQYDGSRYHGWQRQKNAVAVSQLVEQAIQQVTGEYAPVTGCSRTDAGVHALKYVCNFKSATRVPMEKLPIALNTKLPWDIRVLRCGKVPEEFHARFSATAKTYRYLVDTSPIPSPFYKRYSFHFPYQICLEHMAAATKFFEGTHDFSAFMATGSNQKTTVRTVRSLEVEQMEPQMLRFTITADAYLYNMVRIIVGTLVYVGCGKISFEEIPQIISAGDRRRAGITAPPEGLFLKEIEYPKDAVGNLIV